LDRPVFSACQTTFLRYFGTITIWYLHSHFAWDWLCHSCIWLSFQSRQAFQEGEPILPANRKHAETAEPGRVHGHRPWF
jgi:hypothetical protein